ncbi:MAG: V-containing nitrogenase subunit delta [Azospirillaceae bacterium]|nr:V-containing nitrogenase subunit delta [Azospirillaceae bacterium]
MSSDKIDQLFDYVQERCLWQFFSRSWDRQENIDGIIRTATDLLTGVDPKRDQPMDRLFYADAKIMVADFRERFPWITAIEPAEVRALMGTLRERIVDLAITRSQNHELSHSIY